MKILSIVCIRTIDAKQEKFINFIENVFLENTINHIANNLNPRYTNALSAADIECEFKDDIAELLIDEAVAIVAGDISDAANAMRGSQMAEKNN